MTPPSSWVRLAPFATAAVVIVVGWAVLSGAMRNTTLLPSPLAVVETLGSLVASGTLWRDTGSSVGRIFLSWGLAAAVAIPLGIAMGRSERLERFVRPFVELFRPISPIAWIPLAKTVLFVTHSIPEAIFLADRIVVMTSHPGRVKAVIDVDQPRPRDVTSAEFNRVQREVMDLLRPKLRHNGPLRP